MRTETVIQMLSDPSFNPSTIFDDKDLVHLVKNKFVEILKKNPQLFRHAVYDNEIWKDIASIIPIGSEAYCKFREIIKDSDYEAAKIANAILDQREEHATNILNGNLSS